MQPGVRRGFVGLDVELPEHPLQEKLTQPQLFPLLRHELANHAFFQQHGADQG